jgi:hypothetical protein
MILKGTKPVAEMANETVRISFALYELYSCIAFSSITADFFTTTIHRLSHILDAKDEENTN